MAVQARNIEKEQEMLSSLNSIMDATSGLTLFGAGGICIPDMQNQSIADEEDERDRQLKLQNDLENELNISTDNDESFISNSNVNYSMNAPAANFSNKQVIEEVENGYHESDVEDSSEIEEVGNGYHENNVEDSSEYIGYNYQSNFDNNYLPNSSDCNENKNIWSNENESDHSDNFNGEQSMAKSSTEFPIDMSNVISQSDKSVSHAEYENRTENGYKMSTNLENSLTQNDYLHSGSNYNRLQLLYEARGRELDRLSDELCNLKKQADEKIISLKQSYIAEKTEKDSLVVARNQLNILLSNNESKIKSLSEDLRNQSNQNKKLLAEKKASRRDLDIAEGLVKSLETQMSQFQSNDIIANTRKTHESFLQKLQSCHKDEVDGFKKKLNSSHNRNKELEAQIDLMRKELKVLRDSKEMILQEKAQTFKSLEMKLNAAQSQIDILLSTKSSGLSDSYKIEIERLKSDLEKSDTLCKNYKSQLDEFNYLLKLGVLNSIIPTNDDTVNLRRALDFDDTQSLNGKNESAKQSKEIDSDDNVTKIKHELLKSLYMNQMLKNENHSLNENLGKKEKRIMLSQSELKSKNQISDKKIDEEKSLDSADILKAEIQKLKDDCEKLKLNQAIKLEACKQSYIKYHQENTSKLKKELNNEYMKVILTLKSKMEETEISLAEAQQNYLFLSKENDKLSEFANKNKNRSDDNESVDLKHQVEELTSTVNNLKLQYSLKVNENEDLDKKLKDLDLNYKNKVASFEKKLLKVTEVDADISLTPENMHFYDTKQKFKSLLLKNQEFQTETQKLQEKYLEEIKNLKESIKNLESKITELKESREADVNKVLKEKENQRLEYENQVKMLNERIILFSAHVSTVIEDSKKTIESNYEHELKILREKTDDLRNLMEDLENDKIQLKNEHQVQVDEFLDAKQKLVEENNKLLNEKQTNVNKIEKLFTEKQKLTDESEKLLSEKQKLTDESEKLLSEKQKLTDENEKLLIENKKLNLESNEINLDLGTKIAEYNNKLHFLKLTEIQFKQSETILKSELENINKKFLKYKRLFIKSQSNLEKYRAKSKENLQLKEKENSEIISDIQSWVEDIRNIMLTNLNKIIKNLQNIPAKENQSHSIDIEIKNLNDFKNALQNMRLKFTKQMLL